MTFFVRRGFKDKFIWHFWFAWFPVRVGKRDEQSYGAYSVWLDEYVWWEWVERKGLTTSRQYRRIQEQP